MLLLLLFIKLFLPIGWSSEANFFSLSLTLSCRLYRTKKKKDESKNITKCALDSLSSAT